MKMRLTGWRLFHREIEPTSAWEIIAWWEARRIPFNLIVGVTGIVSGTLMLGTALVSERLIGEPIGFPGSPLFELMAVGLYGIMANVCFTGGWILELLSRRMWVGRVGAFGEVAFAWGTLFSVILTLLPAALVVVYAAFRISVR